MRIELLPLVAALLAGSAALAADGAGAPAAADDRAAPARKAASATADPNRLPRGAPDPIEHLRRRLAEKLGATRSATTPHPGVLQVGTRSGAAADREAAVAATLPAPKLAARAARPANAVRWSYGGPGGPAQWGRLKPEYAACAKGRRQSPIDFSDAIRVDLEPIRFDYQPGAFRVVDNGRTIEVKLAPGSTIEARGRRFELEQFHFHRPSEETIDGRRFEMSLHLVHRDAAGRIAVVAVLLDSGAALPAVQQVWNNLPLEPGEEMTPRTPLDPGALLPAERGYFATMGSLTTPPCDEGVLWLVMQQPVTVSPEQIAVFSRLYPMNARPLQPAAGRLIQASH